MSQSTDSVPGAPGTAPGWETVLEMARRLPEMEEGTCYGTPALRVKGRFVARLKEDGETLVVKVNIFERPFLIEADPEVYFITDHYRDYPSVLVRLPRVQPAQLAERLEESWR